MNSEPSSGIAASYRVTGMDCPACAAKIERAASNVRGVRKAKVSIVSQSMTLQLEDGTDCLPLVESAVSSLGYGLSRFNSEVGAAPGESSEAPAPYRRSLKLVAGLNLGYGLAEMIGGFWAGSQALKADALDFLGDGSITLFGLFALGWTSVWRARAAFAQGIFLGVFGTGVLLSTAYRVFARLLPEAELMGIFGAGALTINLLSAVLLLPHRSGEANVRAVWLFSRNDAIGNLAVVFASILVASTRTPWPDLAVAAFIALLFLHSASSIIRDAVNDLRK